MTDGSKHEIDPVTLSVVEGVLGATQQSMTVTMQNTGRSSVYTVARDYSNALFDAEGRMILQGEDIPTHLGSLHIATREVIDYFKGDINPGDVFVHNDPTYGGSHLADMCVYLPIFFEGSLVFWAVSKGHVVDIGGPVPGSYNSDAKEIFAEGLRIPPVRIVEQGSRREDVINLILTNVRSRRNQVGDMNAQLGAVRVADRRLVELLQSLGKDVVVRCVDRMLDLAETHMRERIRSLPDGRYRSSVLAEDSGHGLGDKALEAEIEVEGDEMRISLSSPPQLEFYTNSYRSNTLSGVYAGIMMFSQLQPPFNEGLYRPVTIDFGPPGTMLNATEPAPHMNCTGGPQETICDLVRLALQEADPRRATAGWNHTWAVNITGKAPGEDEPYIELMISTLVGGAGAVSEIADGWEAIGSQAGLGGAQIGEAEVMEKMAPVIVHRMSIAQDTCIPGRWRGGCGLITEIEPIDHEMTVISWGEGGRQPAVSVDGAGAPEKTVDRKVSRGYVISRKGDVRHAVTRNEVVQVQPGERFRNRSAGGGGAGSPLRRPVEAVMWDVRLGKISRGAAMEEYGVIIDPDTLDVQIDATEEERSIRQ